MVQLRESAKRTRFHLGEVTVTEAKVRIGGTLYSDSLGPPQSPAGTYVGMIRHNTRTLVEALQ